MDANPVARLHAGVGTYVDILSSLLQSVDHRIRESAVQNLLSRFTMRRSMGIEAEKGSMEIWPIHGALRVHTQVEHVDQIL